MYESSILKSSVGFGVVLFIFSSFYIECLTIRKKSVAYIIVSEIEVFLMDFGK